MTRVNLDLGIKSQEWYLRLVLQVLFNSLHAGVILHVFFFCFFLLSADFFFKLTFFLKKKSFRNTIRVKMVWIQIRPDTLSGLILVQTVCKSYQMPLAGNELNYTTLWAYSADKKKKKKIFVLFFPENRM